MTHSNNYPPILEEFLAYIQTILNRSELTAEKYASDLSIFFRYLLYVKNKGRGDIDEIDISAIDSDFLSKVKKTDIIGFLLYLMNDRGNKPAIRTRRLSAIKAFFKYLTITTNTLKENPAITIDSPTVKQALPKFLSLDESVSLLDAVNADNSGEHTARDYAILTLFLNCGMRLAELVGINLRDISTDFETIRVVGKGNKERFIYLNDACVAAIKQYLGVRNRIEGIRDPEALFLSRLKRRISREMVQKLVEKYLNLSGLEDKHYSTHKLRHTAATLMYQSGNVDVRVLKDILGHEQLNTTQIYTHVSNQQMSQAMSFNPLSDIKPKKNAVKGAVKDDEDIDEEN